ncbi:hypothetical protein LYNGBM3L_56670 [Moorena producens 3L]|uniref:Uncharacterized protein n=1 Tax=Moorena producens 3L TaxID=489825 RepID=F4XZ97_9CYAN|nr:hypothetical protein LYNGBM3L_56670 [Moorena producens 3L]
MPWAKDSADKGVRSNIVACFLFQTVLPPLFELSNTFHSNQSLMPWPGLDVVELVADACQPMSLMLKNLRAFAS